MRSMFLSPYSIGKKVLKLARWKRGVLRNGILLERGGRIVARLSFDDLRPCLTQLKETRRASVRCFEQEATIEREDLGLVPCGSNQSKAKEHAHPTLRSL